MRPPMNRIDAPTLLTIIYVLVDDWYQEQGYRLTPMLPGPEPSFSDSEMLTFWFIPSSLLILTNAPAAESVLQFIQGNNILACIIHEDFGKSSKALARSSSSDLAEKQSVF